jgi:alkylhydroperoxidase family enzyme
MRIHPVEKDEASPIVRRIYDSIEKSGRSVSNLLKLLAHRPEVLRAYNQLSGAMWVEGTLEPKLKELAFLRVSILNACEY